MSKKLLLIRFMALAIVVSMTFAVGSDAAIELPAGTTIEVVFEQDVSSKYVTPGYLIPIRLQKAVEVGGIVVVKEGAKGSARVKSVKPAGKAGKPGHVEVELLELEPNGSYQAEGDKKITLEAVDGTLKAQGKGRKTLSYLLIFGLFIKGTEGVIPADTPIKAKVTEDIIIIVE